MTKTVNVEVYCDTEDGEKEVFAVASEHRPDLPKPFNEQLQKWAKESFDTLEVGDSIPEAGEMVYEPNGEIIEIKKRPAAQEG